LYQYKQLQLIVRKNYGNIWCQLDDIWNLYTSRSDMWLVWESMSGKENSNFIENF